jgi:hypothetical protein
MHGQKNIKLDKNRVYITDKIHEADPLLWEANRHQLTKKFRALYETKNLIPLFTTACHCQPGKSNLQFHTQCGLRSLLQLSINA